MPLASGLFYNALNSGQVNVSDVFTTDPELGSGKYVVLTDPKHEFGYQNAALIVKQSVLGRRARVRADGERGQRPADDQGDHHDERRGGAQQGSARRRRPHIPGRQRLVVASCVCERDPLGTRSGQRRVALPTRLGKHSHEGAELGVLGGLAALSLDALSSVAYGPEAMVLVLVLAGAGALHDVVEITAVIAAMLVLLVISYSQVIEAHPEGAGRTRLPRRTWAAGRACWPPRR